MAGIDSGRGGTAGDRTRGASRTGTGWPPRAVPLALIFALAVPAWGCVTVAEHRKLERQVIDLQRQRGASKGREQLADLAAEVESLSARLRELDGRIEEVAQTAEKGLSEARKARREAAAGAGPGAGASAALGATGRASGGQSAAAGAVAGTTSDDVVDEVADDGELSDEVRAYQEALAATRAHDYQACIDRFRAFLQTYASSSRADDAAFWIGDCHYRQGEFKQAVVRFDDVVRNYPTGNRAPDALYRQGESLLKLGPTFHPAARRAFERVLKEYPDSARAVEARHQLELQGSG